MLNKLNDKLNYKKNHFIYFLGILILMSAATMIIFSPLCPGIDFYVHFNRLSILIEAFGDGSFPYYMDYYVLEEYGYIIKIFYSDFLLIPFGIIGHLTNEIFAFQSLIFIMFILCGSFTYLTAYRITKSRAAAAITAILYTFCYYRIARLYLGGVIGEMIALSCLPLIIWGAYEIITGNKKRWYILTIGFSLVIFSHVITTTLATISLVIFLLIYIKKIQKKTNFISISSNCFNHLNYIILHYSNDRAYVV